MIGMDKIEDIRRLWRRGESIAGIARKVGVSEPTARKYIFMEDLSPKPPKPRRHREGGVLDPYKDAIEDMLAEDRKAWHKQRHTAKRIFDRLVDERGYEGSYSTVRRYVRERRDEIALEADTRDEDGYLDLVWDPGTVQVDFGQAYFRFRGVETKGHYLTVSFPHSNAGFTQVFWGERSECVCQGLQNVFRYVGGVPVRAVFDNATEVGRKLCGKAVVSELFRAFAAHYGLDYDFTNPYSGNEKGNVEAKVGYHRRNLFVPTPSFDDVESYNAGLLDECAGLSEKQHYKKNLAERELFGEDRAALLALPGNGFSCVAWKQYRCNRQGSFVADGNHHYFAGPAYAKKDVSVAMGAFEVTVVDRETGTVIATYEREWGEAPTSSSDPSLQLRLLCMRPGGWRNTSVRQHLAADVVAAMDSMGADELRACLAGLRDASASFGWGAAAEGMSRALALTGSLAPPTVAVCAQRAASGDAVVDYGRSVDLSVYDGAFGVRGHKAGGSQEDE